MSKVLPILMAGLLAWSSGSAIAKPDDQWQKAAMQSARTALQQRLVKLEDVIIDPVGHMSENPCPSSSPIVLKSTVATSEIRVRMLVRTQIECAGKEISRYLTTWFAVSASADVPVALRNLKVGQEVLSGDIGWQRRDLAKLRGTSLPVFEESVRLRAITPIAKGETILASQVEKMPDVVAGTPVNALYRDDAVTLQFVALAEKDAKLGERLTIQRAGALESLAARVTGPGTVEVSP